METYQIVFIILLFFTAILIAIAHSKLQKETTLTQIYDNLMELIFPKE